DVDRIEPQAFAVQRRLRIDGVGGDVEIQGFDEKRGDLALQFGMGWGHARSNRSRSCRMGRICKGPPADRPHWSVGGPGRGGPPWGASLPKRPGKTPRGGPPFHSSLTSRLSVGSATTSLTRPALSNTTWYSAKLDCQ